MSIKKLFGLDKDMIIPTDEELGIRPPLNKELGEKALANFKRIGKEARQRNWEKNVQEQYRKDVKTWKRYPKKFSYPDKDSYPKGFPEEVLYLKEKDLVFEGRDCNINTKFLTCKKGSEQRKIVISKIHEIKYDEYQHLITEGFVPNPYKALYDTCMLDSAEVGLDLYSKHNPQTDYKGNWFSNVFRILKTKYCDHVNLSDTTCSAAHYYWHDARAISYIQFRKNTMLGMSMDELEDMVKTYANSVKFIPKKKHWVTVQYLKISYEDKKVYIWFNNNTDRIYLANKLKRNIP